MSLAMMDPGLGLPGLETFTAEVCNQTHPNAADSPAATGLIEPSPYGPANEATNTKCLRIGKSLRCGQASCGYNLLAALASIAALITILYACFRVYNRAKGRRTQRRRLSDTDTDDSDSDRLIVSLCENSSDEDELEAPESPTETYVPASKRPRMDRAQELGHTTGRPQQQQTAIRVSVIKFQPKSQGQSEPQPSSPPHTSATASLSAPVQTGMHQQAVGGPWGLALEQEAALGHGEGARQQAIGQREASIAVESLGGPWGPALQQEAALGRGEGARPAARHPVTEPVGQGNMQRHISLFDAQSGFPIIFSPCAGTSDSDSDERSSTATTQSAPILASLLAPSPKEEDYLSHPFARLPVVRGRRGPYYVDFEGALFAENVTQNPLPLLRLVHGLLSQQEIAGEQLEFLATLGSKLAAHATKLHRLGLRYATPSRACERLGTRFLVLDAVVSTAIVLEQKVSLQLWRRFVSTISHEYPKPPASMTNRGRRFFLANFAVLLSNAVKTLKMGFRPSAEELVLLKRMLFCAPYSPPRYKAEGYDAWRFSELVHQGSTGTPSARTAEASSAKFSEASRDVAPKPYPGTSARLIRSARAKAPSRIRRETSGSFAGSPAGSPAESSKPAAASAQPPHEANIGFLYQVPAPTHSGPYRGPFSGVFPGTSDGMSLESRSGSAFHTVRRRREGAEEPHRIPLSGSSARNESHSPRPVSSIEHFPGPSASGSYLPPLASAETSAEISGLPLSPYLFPLLHLLLDYLLERLLDHLLEGLPKRLLVFLRYPLLVDMLVDIFQCTNLLVPSLDRLLRASLNELLDPLLGLLYFMLKRLWTRMLGPLLCPSASPLVGSFLAMKLWEVRKPECLWILMVALMMALLEVLKLLVCLLKEALTVTLIPLRECLVGDLLGPLNRRLRTNKGPLLCFHLAPIRKMEHAPTVVLISSGHQ
ncbi:hypothetical protein, conserved [Eimeria necatrix]|uniref:Uncharacterized protein n=1 Tax=Eimeria necatrix TaxID=51315 RepID=U6MXE7_9EIME|nr:hypothetical protein, conserved [Eimeria necatrix]CDJ67693.1 hypothetical protein, conserved [Eimeria necatrix]